jgi:hypothetical protein
MPRGISRRVFRADFAPLVFCLNLGALRVGHSYREPACLPAGDLGNLLFAKDVTPKVRWLGLFDWFGGSKLSPGAAVVSRRIESMTLNRELGAGELMFQTRAMTALAMQVRRCVPEREPNACMAYLACTLDLFLALTALADFDIRRHSGGSSFLFFLLGCFLRTSVTHFLFVVALTLVFINSRALLIVDDALHSFFLSARETDK